MARVEEFGLQANAHRNTDLNDPEIFTGAHPPDWVNDDDIVAQLVAASPTRISELWSKGHRPGDDKSANDFSVATVLARLAGSDVDRIKRILLANETIKRLKWDTHRNYLERTIRKAIVAVHKDPSAHYYVWPASRAKWTARMRREKTDSRVVRRAAEQLDTPFVKDGSGGVVGVPGWDVLSRR